MKIRIIINWWFGKIKDSVKDDNIFDNKIRVMNKNPSETRKSHKGELTQFNLAGFWLVREKP